MELRNALTLRCFCSQSTRELDDLFRSEGVSSELSERLSHRLGRLWNASAQGPPEPIEYKDKKLDFSQRPLLMAVLNVTPDSFFDGGRFFDHERAVEKAQGMIAEGADIIDVGGASTRPGSELVSDEIQEERVLPVVRALRMSWPGWISVDTYSARVARAAIGEGADMINDISAGRLDPAMKDVASESGVPCILMHMKGRPRAMQNNPVYHDLIQEILDYFRSCIQEWEDAGVSREKILVDPGIGFGKTLEHNLRIIKNLQEFETLGRPIVLGTSRKSFIGTVLNRDVEDRLSGTLATLVVGVLNGAHLFRVHDVQEAHDVLAMAHAISQA